MMNALIPCLLATLGTATAQNTEASARTDGEWIELFDGETLDGWRQRNGTATYEVRDGTIVGTTAEGSPNSFLCSERFFGDFELRFEVKLFDDELNSGVQIRSHSYPAFKNGRVHGYQVEVSTNGNAGFIYDEARRGWLSKDRSDEAARAAFKRGEWNAYRVVCHGDKIHTWINGTPIAKVTDSMDATGFIGLQVHSVRGDPKWQVAWRNLKLREIGDGGGWVSLFDGESLDGWRASEPTGQITVEDGAIRVAGRRSHLFYVGDVHSHDFKNFELRATVKTEAKANSGIYFHTEFQERGWPSKGYEVQINNSHSDWRRTGGLYAVDDVREAPAKDGEWFDVHVTVNGKHIAVAVDGKPLIDYTEPPNPKRRNDMRDRLLSNGTFALQAHDPVSVIYYKAILVKLLPY